MVHGAVNLRYCPGCSRNVLLKERWTSESILIFFILFLIGIIPGLVYLLYKESVTVKCPACGRPAREMTSPQSGGEPVQAYSPSQSGTSMSFEQRFCIFCGSRISPSDTFCPYCGNRNK